MSRKKWKKMQNKWKLISKYWKSLEIFAIDKWTNLQNNKDYEDRQRNICTMVV